MPDNSHFFLDRASELPLVVASIPPSDIHPSKRHLSDTPYYFRSSDERLTQYCDSSPSDESLPDENLLDKPVSHDTSFDEFQNLQTKWDAMPTNFDGRTKWIEDLEEEHGSDYVDRLLLWMQQNPNQHLFPIKQVTDEEFVSILKRVDWLGDKTALGKMNARLWSPSISSVPDFYLGLYKNGTLLLRLHGRALRPRESDITTCESNGISFVNLHLLLGIRYKPLDQKLRDQEMLFVTLGNIYYSVNKQVPVNQIINDEMDTGFLLLLEVKSSGGPGELYVSYSSTDQDPAASAIAGAKGPIPTFPNAPAPFTLAKLSPTDLELGALQVISRTGPIMDKKIDLVPVSGSMLEIAETGMKENWTPNNPPIPLFPRDLKE